MKKNSLIFILFIINIFVSAQGINITCGQAIANKAFEMLNLDNPEGEDINDCSHFVHKVYADACFPYVYLPSSSFNLSPKFFKAATPQPGDVVLFTGHMGIFISDNVMIHWSDSRQSVRSEKISNIGKPAGYYRYRL